MHFSKQSGWLGYKINYAIIDSHFPFFTKLFSIWHHRIFYSSSVGPVLSDKSYDWSFFSQEGLLFILFSLLFLSQTIEPMRLSKSISNGPDLLIKLQALLISCFCKMTAILENWLSSFYLKQKRTTWIGQEVRNSNKFMRSKRNTQTRNSPPSFQKSLNIRWWRPNEY